MQPYTNLYQNTIYDSIKLDLNKYLNSCEDTSRGKQDDPGSTPPYNYWTCYYLSHRHPSESEKWFYPYTTNPIQIKFCINKNEYC